MDRRIEGGAAPRRGTGRSPARHIRGSPGERTIAAGSRAVTPSSVLGQKGILLVRTFGGSMSQATTDTTVWYRSLDARQWNTLLASNLGWLFDGYETYA